MMPEIWLPTVTLVTGLSVPVAVTAWVMSPRVTFVVWYSGASPFLLLKYHTPPPTAPASTIPSTSHFFQDELPWFVIRPRSLDAERRRHVKKTYETVKLLKKHFDCR